MLLRRVTRWFWSLCAVVGFALTLMVAQVQWEQWSAIRPSIEKADKASYAIVLGASVKQDGTASDALVDRVTTSVDLFKQGKVEKILMTGDDGKFHTDEVSAMKKLALDQGVPDQAVLVDGHGYRTYESCKRAAKEFGVKDAIIVTQRFHLGRSLYLCHGFGIDAQGIAADRQSYEKIVSFMIREIGASVKAWWDTHIQEPKSPVE